MVNLDYLYNPAAAKPHFEKNYFSDKKLGFQVIEKGMILPHKRTINGKSKDFWGFGGIVDGQGKYIKASSLHFGIGESYTPPPESIKRSPETVIYLGIFAKTWGHTITDGIRRLWFLINDVFKREFKDCFLAYIKTSDRGDLFYPNSPYIRLLDMVGIDVDRLKEINQPTQFDKIILPDESFCREFTEEYRETIDHIKNFALKNRTPTLSKKIYYFHGRRGFGEERLAEYFKSKGYEIIRPEKLTLDEQLNLLINAESFAATIGSISHNSVFLRDGTETIFIPRGASAATNSYQRTLNQVNSLNANYIDSTLTLYSLLNSNILYIVSPQLKRFFGDKSDGYEEEDFKNFLQYVKNSINKSIAFNKNGMTYYKPVFEDFMAQLKQHEDLIAACNMPPKWEEFRQTLTYQTHVAKKGWGSWNGEDQISNDIEQQRQIEAIKINSPTHKVYYSVYYNDKEGWSEEVSNSEPAGTTGKSKAIMGIKIYFDEAGAKKFDILYRVHKFDGTWTDWAKNGEVIYSHGQKLNAVQIKLETKT